MTTINIKDYMCIFYCLKLISHLQLYSSVNLYKVWLTHLANFSIHYNFYIPIQEKNQQLFSPTDQINLTYDLECYFDAPLIDTRLVSTNIVFGSLCFLCFKEPMNHLHCLICWHS